MAQGKEPNLMPLAKGRITVAHLQRMKDRGELISMVGTGPCEPMWIKACENAGVNLVRYTASGESTLAREQNLYPHTRAIRKMASTISLNAVMQTHTYADKHNAVRVASMLMSEGADSVMPMGVTNETLKYMSDHYVPVFGHVGCLSGWHAVWFGGYSRVGKTAEDAMRVFRQAYEYQENGMVGMTIEMSSRDLTNAIAKKLRVPVIQVAAGGCADGSELVIYDLLGFQSKSTMAKHAKCYREFYDEAIKAFAEYDADVKNRVYPAEEHGWGMDEKELEKFMNELEQKY